MRHGHAHVLRFDVRDPMGHWRTALSHRAENKHRPWEKDETPSVEDLEIAASEEVSTAVFTEIDSQDPTMLIRRGEIPGHRLEEHISIVADNRLRVEVRDRISRSGIQLSRLMNHYYFMPDNRAMGYALPLDFAWLPGVHDNEEARGWRLVLPVALRHRSWPMACTRLSSPIWI